MKQGSMMANAVGTGSGGAAAVQKTQSSVRPGMCQSLDHFTSRHLS